MDLDYLVVVVGFCDCYCCCCCGPPPGICETYVSYAAVLNCMRLEGESGIYSSMLLFVSGLFPSEYNGCSGITASDAVYCCTAFELLSSLLKEIAVAILSDWFSSPEARLLKAYYYYPVPLLRLIDYFFG